MRTSAEANNCAGTRLGLSWSGTNERSSCSRWVGFTCMNSDRNSGSVIVFLSKTSKLAASTTPSSRELSKDAKHRRRDASRWDYVLYWADERLEGSE